MLKPFPEYGRKPAGTVPFSETLRRMIVGRIHAGWLRPGDRLPSIRDLASRSHIDHRVAARAYRLLAQEGLVEILPKSGVFVSPSLTGGLEPTQSGSWAADVLFDAWQKGISRSSLCGLFGGMIASPLRCACIESNEDHLVAIAAEIEDGLGLELIPVLVNAAADEETPPIDEIVNADLIVSSVFHTKYARATAEAVGKPLAIMNLRREFTAEIGRSLAAGPVTVVMVDPEYERRGREFFAATHPATSVRFISIEEVSRVRPFPEGDSVLYTRAARRRLGMEDFHLIPSQPLISMESARALCEIVTAAAPRRRPRLRMREPDAGRDGVRSAERARESDGRKGPEETRTSLEIMVCRVEEALRTEGLFGALRVLNSSTRHRFTAIYRFEPGWVRSVVLFDRENPELRVGADVPMKESYCILAADAGANYRVENALDDPRLKTHHAREAVLCYCAVHLVDTEGASWGTLCHYDLRAAEIEESTMAVLEAVRPLFQAVLGPATPYVCLLPDGTERTMERRT